VKLVPNYNISKAKFAIHNTVATLLHNDCQQIDIKTKELYCFLFVLCKNAHKVAETGKNLFLPCRFKPPLAETCQPCLSLIFHFKT